MFHCMYVPHFAYYLFTDGHLSDSYILAIVNNAAVNIDFYQ